MLLHAREGHVELPGKGRDRSVCTPQLLQNAASGGVRERAERDIEAGLAILNHTVQDTNGLTACNVRLSAPCVAGHAPNLTSNGTAFTVATVRIVGYPEVDLWGHPFKRAGCIVG